MYTLYIYNFCKLNLDKAWEKQEKKDMKLGTLLSALQRFKKKDYKWILWKMAPNLNKLHEMDNFLETQLAKLTDEEIEILNTPMKK